MPNLPISSSEYLEITCETIEFFSDRYDVLLVVDEITPTEELGNRQCDSLTVSKLGVQISDRCCAMRQLSQNILST